MSVLHSPSPFSLNGSERPRRLTLSSRRRGSVSAPDPWGTFQDTERGMFSMLHIIKAPSVSASQDAEERAFRKRSAGVSHTRANSGSSTGGRISFAFSGFSPIASQRDSMSSPRGAHHEACRLTSPLSGRPPLSRSNSASNASSYTPLTPMQVYELAQQCNNPSPGSRPPTPGGREQSRPSSVTYAPLPESHRLPFLDRPEEVKELISSGPTHRLFALLSQSFTSKGPGEAADPVTWNFAQLERWLTQTTRAEASDAEWICKIKACISAKSELIWERVKGAFGVPPELDAPHNDMDESNIPEHHETFDDVYDSFGPARVEPIIADPNTSPISPSRPSAALFRHSPDTRRSSLSRMQNISEDAPESDSKMPLSPHVHGLRVITSPSPPPSLLSSPVLSSAGSFSNPHVPYDVVAERGPGNPLFPSTFANLALGPTLKANNPALQSPPVPPASAYPFSSSSQSRRKVPSWADGWDLQKQEYAVSAASGSSRRSVPVE